MTPPSLAGFHIKARQYVFAKGWDGADAEDLVQWMLVEALAKPQEWLAVSWCYAHALDHLNPRHRTGQPWRLRSRVYGILEDMAYGDEVPDDEIARYHRHVGAGADVCLSGASSQAACVEGLGRFHANTRGAPALLPDVLWWAQVVRALAACAPDPRTRRMFRRYVWEDWRMHEIATAEGVTEARVSQILSAVRATLRAHLAQEGMP